MKRNTISVYYEHEVLDLIKSRVHKNSAYIARCEKRLYGLIDEPVLVGADAALQSYVIVNKLSSHGQTVLVH